MTKEEATNVLKEIIDESWIFSDIEKAPTIDACEMAISALSENKGEWIPVGWIPNGKCGYPKPEDEYKHFLTIDNKGEITIQEFLLSLDEEPQPYFSGMRNIVAWMPLPEPYKADMRGE